MNRFTVGGIRTLVSKPSIAGFGLNWQNCHNMIFVGLSDSYEMMYQAIRRCWRFGQTHDVYVHIITSEAEGAVKENIDRKEKQSTFMVNEMVKHTKVILEEEIRGTTRQTIPYNPQVEMIIPDWLRSA
jgi:SNF2 family DNA or RNA helicase